MKGSAQVDLTTQYLGLTLRNPLVASASPMNLDIGHIRRLEECGAAAIVLPSIFEEQFDQEEAARDRLAEIGGDSSAEALSYFPQSVTYNAGPHRYLRVIEQARAAVKIPIIASLNGVTNSGWTCYARLIEEAGASAIELNAFFVPTDLDLDGASVERRQLDILRSVKAAVGLPVAVKLSPYFSAVGNMVRQLDDAGADGFVLFNRFYQPDFNLQTMTVERSLELSSPSEMRLPLLWLGVLTGQVRGSLAATTGVESSDDAVKYLLAGADVVMTTSSLLRHGPQHMRTLLAGLEEWIEGRDLPDVSAMRGLMSRQRLRDRTGYDRANYISILQGWQK